MSAEIKEKCLQNLDFARKQVDCLGFVLKDDVMDSYAMSNLDIELTKKIDKIRPKMLELYSLLDDIANHINRN